MSFKPQIAAVAAAFATFAAQASVFTVEFTANGFVNAGTPYPGHSGPISGSFSWDAASTSDAITAFTAFDMAIAGHQYTLGEIGIANNGSSQTAFGGLVNGANAVVGNGQFDDFLFVFDRVAPGISAFAFSIQGLNNALWWTPTETSIRYVTTTSGVPEPASGLLVLAALGALAGLRRRT